MLKVIFAAVLGVTFIGAAGPAAANMQMQNSMQMRSSVTVVQSGGGYAGGFPAGGYYGSSYQAPPTVVTVIPRPQPIYVEPAPVYIEPQTVAVTVPEPEREEVPVIIHEEAPRKTRKPVKHHVIHHIARQPIAYTPLCRLPDIDESFKY